MVRARDAVLLVPAVFLALSLDRIDPDRLPPAVVLVPTWEEAAPALPGRNEGRFGRPGDPLNIVFVGTAGSVRAALTAAGWTEVPTATRRSLAAGAAELLAGRTLASFPPMNDYRLLGRRQDMNWALPVRGVSERHHFRLWRTGMIDRLGRSYWWGSGNHDLAVRWRDLSHVPDPDSDRERDELVRSLEASPAVEALVVAPLPQIPADGVNDKGYPFRTDGRVAVVVLRAPRPKR
ncbi:MAG: LssY C-terminal domain-containing protein [Elusimicrobia bacterium]|nr:LssY C-terminal domain-containing protein [Elusimicrobiota bacterium]